jgi:hypothetical protein
MVRLAASIAAFAALTAPAAAELTLKQMQTAMGLAQIISGAKHCGYLVDQPALERYFATTGLDNPEALAYISSNVWASNMMDEQTPSTCTISKMTAKNIGVLAP